MAQVFHSVGHGQARLAIIALRGGTAAEMSEFLIDADTAYNALYRYLMTDEFCIDAEFFDYYPAPIRIREAMALSRFTRRGAIAPEDIVPLPNFQLQVKRISINSPGFWEFFGGLNPLLHLREYLRERHERTKDLQYRNKAEQERLILENEILQQTLVNKQLENLRMAREMEREFPFEEAVRSRAWELVGPSLAKLGRHQDTGLIAGPIEQNDESAA